MRQDSRLIRRAVATLFILLLAVALAGCGGGGGPQSGPFVTALDTTPATFDPLDGTDAASERLRQLMFNSLVRKNETFDYVGDLAESFEVTDEGRAVTFKLRDGVKFHDGRPLTSADAKYTIESLLSSGKKKAPSFFEAAKPAGTPASGQNSNSPAPAGDAAKTPGDPYITAVEAPDARTLVIRLRKPWNQLLPNLVSVPVIPQGSADAQKQQPLGSGPFRFVRFDESQQIVDLAAFDEYWQGAPSIKELRVRTILDANTLQAELQSGQVTLVSGAANLTPDAFRLLGQDPRLKVEQFPGANIVYLGFNVERAPLDNVKVRQAIAHAVDREGIVRDLQLGQARVGHSILPESSWAYDAGQKIAFDPARSKQLLDEAGLRDPDGDGPAMRLRDPIVFRISAGNTQVSQYAGVIQNSLKLIGIPVEIETFETTQLIRQLNEGQYQMSTLRWVGGNQDPTFLRDLFHSSKIPQPARPNFNRSRYSTPELDRILDEAVSTLDRARARELYVQAQQIVSRDVPMLPLWYPDVMVIARRDVGNIRVDPSNDFSFLRNVTVGQQ